MEENFIKLFELIHRWGMDNSMWGFVSDTDTETQFGVSEDIEKIELEGTWLYLYIPFDDVEAVRQMSKVIFPTLSFQVKESKSYILLYNTKITK